MPLFPWTLGKRQTLEKRFNKEQRMAISSSPASPDRGENRPRNLLESETIVWGETNSYSGIGSIWCNNAEDLHYWLIFGLSGSVRGSGSSAASKHLVNAPLLFFVAAFWSVAGCKCGSIGWGNESLYLKAHHKAAALHSTLSRAAEVSVRSRIWWV